MKSRNRGILISMVLTSLSLGATASAQSQPELGPDMPGPTTPRPHPGLPEDMPMPRTSRPAEIIEEKMVVNPSRIRRAQQALRARGLKPGDEGKLDENTQEALTKFQKQNNLPATGVLDDKTAAKLGLDSQPE